MCKLQLFIIVIVERITKSLGCEKSRASNIRNVKRTIKTKL